MLLKLPRRVLPQASAFGDPRIAEMSHCLRLLENGDWLRIPVLIVSCFIPFFYYLWCADGLDNFFSDAAVEVKEEPESWNDEEYSEVRKNLKRNF